ncbi:hypothetical protein Y032_0091g2414 [Ancylostoma ceylanicum]|uniref:Uncharacterized protein n=1 Tax=Ancylostoma ceylanicum TaxID=53326 RepID=A0A016TLA4_9BILA|nr:hypothetical protein Y032_0091g2414 [Ancylostoma ceylanicum]
MLLIEYLRPDSKQGNRRALTRPHVLTSPRERKVPNRNIVFILYRNPILVELRYGNPKYGIPQDLFKFCPGGLFGVLITNIVSILHRNPTFVGIR